MTNLYKIAGIRSDSALWFARQALAAAEAHHWLYRAPGEIPDAHHETLARMIKTAEEATAAASDAASLLYCARVQGVREWDAERRAWTRRRPLGRDECPQDDPEGNL